MIIEKVIFDHLKKSLSVPVFVQFPKDIPDRFVLLDRVGGTESEHTKTASFAVQSYGMSIFEAASLNEDVKEAMSKAIELTQISRIDLDSDYNFTDEEMKIYRYQAIYDLVLF